MLSASMCSSSDGSLNTACATVEHCKGHSHSAVLFASRTSLEWYERVLDVDDLSHFHRINRKRLRSPSFANSFIMAWLLLKCECPAVAPKLFNEQLGIEVWDVKPNPDLVNDGVRVDAFIPLCRTDASRSYSRSSFPHQSRYFFH